MMCDIKKRSSFGPLVNYANNKDKARMIDCKDVRTDNNTTIAASMQGQADDKPGRKLNNPVYHISLNFSKEDAPKLSDGLMVKIAREYMEQMGIRNTQYIVCRHIDTEHPHMHIVANRVDNDGNTISDKNDRQRSVKICRELTLKYGLHMAKGKEKVNRNRLRGSDKIRYEILDALQFYIPKSKSWEELEGYMKEKNIRINLRFDKKKGRITGVSFTFKNRTFSGSKIDESMNFYAIDRRMNHRLTNKKGTEILIGNAENELGSLYKMEGENKISLMDLWKQYHNSTRIFERNSNASHTISTSRPSIYNADNLSEMSNESPATSNENTTPSDDDSSDSDVIQTTVEGLIGGLIELYVQPHQAQVSVGGGGDNDTGDWGDEDKKKNRPRRRR